MSHVILDFVRPALITSYSNLLFSSNEVILALSFVVDINARLYVFVFLPFYCQDYCSSLEVGCVYLAIMSY